MYSAISLDYSSLEPFLNDEAFSIHYKIYLENLKKLNELLNSTSYDYSNSMIELINHIDKFNLNIRGEILYYLSSVLNHNLYFYSLSNQNHNRPVGTIKRDIERDFSSYENFQKQFIEKAMELKGSGYTFLVRDSNGKLLILNTSNEDSPYFYGMIPIISLDLWEHAYFLQYQNNRLAYINNFFKVLDFEKINTYYEKILEE